MCLSDIDCNCGDCGDCKCDCECANDCDCLKDVNCECCNNTCVGHVCDCHYGCFFWASCCYSEHDMGLYHASDTNCCDAFECCDSDEIYPKVGSNTAACLACLNCMPCTTGTGTMFTSCLARDARCNTRAKICCMGLL